MTDSQKDRDDIIFFLLEKNNAKAVDLLYHQYFEKMTRVAFKIIRDNDTAKDITQGLFLNIWLKRERLSIKKPISSYLARSVINRSLNYLRDRNRNQQGLAAGNDLYTGSHEETSLEYADLESMIRNVIGKLPPKCQLIFNLSRWREMSNSEIALQLDISKKAVEKQITKALKHLRHHLKSYLNSSLVAWCCHTSYFFQI